MKWDTTKWRLRGCPSCGGDLYQDPLADKLACLQCGRDCDAEGSVSARAEGMPIPFPERRLIHTRSASHAFRGDAA